MPGRRAPLADRFWAKVDVRGPDECWPWLGVKNNKGYGQIGRGRKEDGKVLAHRASWEIHNGPIPDGMNVLHHCDNPPCCNNAHHFLGTKADNTADMTAKGRDGVTKFGPEIRGAIITSRESSPVLAKRLGVSRTQINRIRRANNATIPAKTHCKFGHPFDGYNLIIRADGGRHCRECGRQRTAVYDKRRRCAQQMEAGQ